MGHLYPRQDTRAPLDQEATLQNKVRIAETWLGSFKETFYRHSPEAFALRKVRRRPAGVSVPSLGPPAGGWARWAPSPLLLGENGVSGLSFPQLSPFQWLLYLVGLSSDASSISMGYQT